MVQQRAGVREAARALSRMIEPRMNPRVGGYLAARELVFLSSVDAGGQPWASAAVGGEGFVEPVSPMELHLVFEPLAGDPILENVKATGELGLLALHAATNKAAGRRRRPRGASFSGRARSLATVPNTFSAGALSRRSMATKRRLKARIRSVNLTPP